MENKKNYYNRDYDKKYRERNKERIKERRKKHWEKNKEKIREKHKEWYDKNKSKLKITSKVYRGKIYTRYNYLIKLAKKRDLECTIDYEYYKDIISMPCHYCNYQLGQQSNSSGLDRLDSSKGYIKDNVVSCCYKCNRIKNNFLTEEETLAAVKAILNFREENRLLLLKN